jgi:hypothetical protein
VTAARPVLLLLSRPGCHLCEALREELEQAFPGRFDLREACVDDRPEWRRRHGLQIPVLLDDAGEVLSRTRLDAEALAHWLEARSRI